MPNAELGDKDPERWWNTFEVNVRGVYNTVRYVVTILSLSRQGLDSAKAPRYRPSRKPAGESWSFLLALRSCVSYVQVTMLLQSMLSTAWLNSSPLVRRHAQPFSPVAASASTTLGRIPQVDSICVAPGFRQDPVGRRSWFPR